VNRIALVTGVSRRVGIGAAVARRLAAAGYRLMLTGLPEYDAAQPYGGDPDGVPGLLTDLDGAAAYQACDFMDPGAPAAAVAATMDRYGAVDALVAVHAYSRHTEVGSLDAGEIDRHLVVNVRATMLLVEAFAGAYDHRRRDGRVVLFSSGQRLGPMTSELAYAASKAGVEVLTRNFAHLLAGRGITVNCVNPGPTDTGYAGPETYEQVRRMFPGGHWGRPDDAARLVEWLCSAEAAWVTGQVIDSEGGFNRYARSD
jgi:3-oxoacyl-[acyl-carrier protein] reductase